MRLRTSAILLSLAAAAACTAEPTAPLAVPARALHDGAVSDTTQPAPGRKGSIMPVVGVPPEGKGGSVPAV